MDDKRKRLLIMGLSGVAVIAASLLFAGPKAPAPEVGSVPQPPAVAMFPPATGSNKTVPALPQGTSDIGRTLRDIFSPPAGYALLAQTPPPASNGEARGAVEKTQAAGPAPVLTGVIAGEGTRVAILRQGTISRSYRVGESAGAYRIAAIGASSVTLSGPGGTRVLTMGQ